MRGFEAVRVMYDREKFWKEAPAARPMKIFGSQTVMTTSVGKGTTRKATPAVAELPSAWPPKKKSSSM